MRFFNTEGPVDCARHYCLPPLARLDMADVRMLIDQQKYFAIHAPPRSGKTTYLLALAASRGSNPFTHQTDPHPRSTRP